jgi:hypothetical protein
MTRALAAALVAVALSGCAAAQPCPRYQMGIDCERDATLDESQLDAPQERNAVADLLFGAAFATALGHILNAIASR